MGHDRKYLAVSFLFFIVTVLFWSQSLLAQALQIMPITVNMSNVDVTKALFVTNLSGQPQMVQVRPFLWTQSRAGDNLSPTRAIAVSPPMTSIASGTTQVFRILLREPAQKVEASYRLLFDQLPPPGDSISGVRLTLRLSVPIFVKPSQPIAAGMAWSVLVDESGAHLHAQNNGDQHLRIMHPVLNQSPFAKFTIPAASVSYILAGAEQDWLIPEGRRLQPGSDLHLTAASDQGPVDATVHVLQR